MFGCARRWRGIFALTLLLSLAILFAPPSNVPSAPEGVDKIVHLLLFLALAATGLLAGIGWRWLAPGLIAYAVASEFIQASPLLGRSASTLDAIADTVGVLLGLLITHLAARKHRR